MTSHVDEVSESDSAGDRFFACMDNRGMGLSDLAGEHGTPKNPLSLTRYIGEQNTF